MHVLAHHPAIESANRNPADPYSSLHIQLTRQRLRPQYGQVEACLSCPLEHEALGIWEEHMWRSSQVPRNGNNTKYNSIPALFPAGNSLHTRPPHMTWLPASAVTCQGNLWACPKLARSLAVQRVSAKGQWYLVSCCSLRP